MAKHGSYGALLLRQEWKEKRKQIVHRDGNKCVICNSQKELVVHHRQYIFSKALQKFNNPWEYKNETLITLCNSCHQRGHTKFEIPIKYIP